MVWRGGRATHLLLLSATLAACATTKDRFPGETQGDRTLQLDTFAQIQTFDAAGFRGVYAGGEPCTDWKVLDTEVVEPLRGAQFDGNRLVAGAWVERWTLDRCGQHVRYRIAYGTSAQHGTVFQIKREN